MNQLLAVSNSLVRGQDVYEKIVLSFLEPMTLGSMKLELPNGQVLLFGNGNEVEANIKVNNKSFFKKLVMYGDIGLGESYVDGDWSTDCIKSVVSWFVLNKENNPDLTGSKVKTLAINLLGAINNFRHKLNLNTLGNSKKNISEHYDLSNEMYKLMLDKTMAYSSAVFTKNTKTLEQAQLNKFKLLCEQLRVTHTDHLLEIGTGWGGLAIYAAQNYSCKVTTITLSQEQLNYTNTKIKDLGLENRVKAKLCDYRNMKGQFDKIVSVEMIEAVGKEFMSSYFEKLNHLLAPNGLVALQAILFTDYGHETYSNTSDWIRKHIFPGGHLPSMNSIQKNLKNTGSLQIYELKDFGLDYARTLNQWFRNFNENTDKIRQQGFDTSFIRKWNYYLKYCEAAFERRNITVSQILLSKPNNTSLNESYEKIA